MNLVKLAVCNVKYLFLISFLIFGGCYTEYIVREMDSVVRAGETSTRVFFKTTTAGSPRIVILDFFGSHQATTQTLSIKPLLTDKTTSGTPTESEYRVLSVVGTWPSDATFSWSSAAGTFSGSGERVNFKLTDGWIGTNGTSAVPIDVTVSSATGGSTSFSKSLAVSVPRPYITVSRVSGAGTNFTITGTLNFDHEIMVIDWVRITPFWNPNDQFFKESDSSTSFGS